jgi:GWxTD domain-containing protein
MVGLLLAVALAQAVPLSEPHQTWLDEEVRFLISKGERHDFLALDSDEARDRFIQDFWRRRDPTPGTARNEARGRHLALLEEADRLFTLVAANRGRFTERGRVYQLLGPPASREDYTHAGNRLFPLELWHYTGILEPFLPGTFYLIFFREGGYGDYRMWSPATDGPQALVQYHEPGRLVLEENFAYEELKRIDVELAQAVQRLVPGESPEQPAFRSESLLNDLRDYSDIAERYIRIKEQVTAKFSFRQLEVSPVAITLQDASGMPQVHYALEFPSANVAWATEENKFLTSFGLNCRMLDAEGRQLDGIEDWLDLILTPDEIETLDGVDFSFQGRLILPPGRYTLEFTLTGTPGGSTDAISVPVVVQEMQGVGASDLLLARSRTRLPSNEKFLDTRPFQIHDFLLSPSPDHVFPATEALAYLQLWGVSEMATLHWKLSQEEEVLWQGETQVSPGEVSPITVGERVPLGSLAGGAYRLSVQTPGGVRETEITVDTSATPQAVRVLSREGLPAGDARLLFRRGILFARLGDTGRAIQDMSEAARLLPRDLEVNLQLAFLLNATSQYERVVELLTPLEPHYPNEADLLVFLGFASLKLGQSAEAASYYERALAQRPGDEKLKSALAEARKLASSASKP